MGHVCRPAATITRERMVRKHLRIHHRATESTEAAQRDQRFRTFKIASIGSARTCRTSVALNNEL
jgi:hypothetical protein